MKTIQGYFGHILLVETVTKYHLASKGESVWGATADGGMSPAHFKKRTEDGLSIGAATLGKNNLLPVCMDLNNKTPRALPYEWLGAARIVTTVIQNPYSCRA